VSKNLKVSRNIPVALNNNRDFKIDEVQPASKTLPTWYKKMPLWGGDGTEGTLREEPGTIPTVKFCIPFVDALSIGYTIVLDEDVIVSIHKEEGEEDHIHVASPYNKDFVGKHSKDQFPGLEVSSDFWPDAQKWKNDLVLETPKGWSLIYTHPFNRFDLPFVSITGIIDSDEFSGMSVLFPFFLKKDFEGVIPKGTPIIQIIPFKRAKWKLLPSVVSLVKGAKFWNKFNSIQLRRYQRLFHVKKSYK